MEFIKSIVMYLLEIWPVIVATLGGVWGLIHIPIVRRFGMMAIRAVMTEAVIKELFLELARKLAGVIDSPVSEAWILELEKATEESKTKKGS